MKCAWVVAAANFFKEFLARLRKAFAGPGPSISFIDPPSTWQDAEPAYSLPPAQSSEVSSPAQRSRPSTAPRDVDPRQLLERFHRTNGGRAIPFEPEVQKFFREN